MRSTAVRAGLTATRISAVAPVDLETHVVGPGAPADGRTLAELALRARHGITVVNVKRGGHDLPEPGPATRLEAADVVVVLGGPGPPGGGGEHLPRRRAGPGDYGGTVLPEPPRDRAPPAPDPQPRPPAPRRVAGSQLDGLVVRATRGDYLAIRN